LKETPKHSATTNHQNKPFFNSSGPDHFFGGQQEPAVANAFFSKTGAQPKLEVGAKNDALEKQADHTADKVVQKLAKPEAHSTPSLQAKANDKGKEEDKLQKKEEEIESSDKKIQKRSAFESDEQQEQKPQVQKKDNTVMLKPNGEATAPPASVETGLNSSKGGGSPMESGTRQNMESAFGADFSKVRIHNDSASKKMSNDLGAQAFAHGNDIYFNEGKYDPNSSSGSHLLAHELTHTIQQGGAVQKKEQPGAMDVQSLQDNMIQKAAAPAVAGSSASNETVDISDGQFNPSEKLKGEIEAAKWKGLDVNITASKLGGGPVTTKITGKKNQFDSLNNNYFKIPVSIPYLAAANPTLHVKINNNVATGEVGTAKSRGDLDNWIAKNAEALGWLGIKVPSLGGKFTNKFENGVLNLGINGVSVTIAEFVTATLSAGFQDLQKPTVNISATVKAAGMAEGTLNINNEKGPLEGSVDIGVNFASFSGNVTAVYKPDGTIDIKGSVGYSGDKLSGSLTLIATDKKTADNFAKQQLGGGKAEETSLPEEVPAAKGKGERGLAGMGALTFNLTEWFAGTVSVIVDGTGAVTVVGKIAPPKEIELFPQKDFDKELFKFEARAAYGIPVVGNVFVFANIALKALAKVGPAKIYNIEIEGTYSTRPDIAKSITIAGSLNMSAYAGLRLRAEGGVGLTVLGHDIKLGVGVNADAGVKGYVDARPVIGYRDPGEFFFKGHMEIAAQPFLGLSGDLFVELDSPWWSPAPDKKWTWPIGSLEYPLPGQFGIGADMEYVLGSGKVPEITFGKADFDGSKFMTDLVDKQVPSGGGKGTQEKPGKFTDGGAAGATPKPAAEPKGGKGDKKAAPPGKGGGKKDKKGKDADKNDELKQMDAAMKKVKALEGGKPLSRVEISSAIDKIKKEHKVAIAFKEQGNDTWLVTLNAKGKGSKQPAKVKRKKGDDKEPQNTDPKKQKQLDEGLKALRDEDKRIAGDGKMNEEEAKKVATAIKQKHDIFKSISVTSVNDAWNYSYIQRKASGKVVGAKVDEENKLPRGVKQGTILEESTSKKLFTVHTVNKKTYSISLSTEDGKSVPYSIVNFTKQFKGGKYTIVKKMDPSIPKMPKTVVEFFRKPEHKKAEYVSQLKGQERGINAMTVVTWDKARVKFKGTNGGRQDEGAQGRYKTQEKARLRSLFTQKYLELNPPVSQLKKDIKAAQKAARDYGKAKAEALMAKHADGKAALHNPDQVAAGDPEGLHGFGDSDINSHIGSQWNSSERIEKIEGAVKKFKESDDFTKSSKKDKAKMNVVLNLT
jgi:hypothetical protein